jgi:hypothetical protein
MLYKYFEIFFTNTLIYTVVSEVYNTKKLLTSYLSRGALEMIGVLGHQCYRVLLPTRSYICNEISEFKSLR